LAFCAQLFAIADVVIGALATTASATIRATLDAIAYGHAASPFNTNLSNITTNATTFDAGAGALAL
jgi:hypothetical protein